MNRFSSLLSSLGVVAVLMGCGTKVGPPQAGSTPVPSTSAEVPTDEIAAERAKLAPADRVLVEAQEWCVVSTDERLGEMGPPLKLDIKGQPVFVCCKGCKKKAEADPDKTLAKVAELKAKAKAERETKK